MPWRRPIGLPNTPPGSASIGAGSRSGAPALRPLRDPRLCYLGQISYGIYLYHYIIITTMEQLCGHYGVARALWLDAVAFALVLGVAALSWRYVEQPILGFKDRFEYRPSPAAPTRVRAGRVPSTTVEV